MSNSREMIERLNELVDQELSDTLGPGDYIAGAAAEAKASKLQQQSFTPKGNN